MKTIDATHGDGHARVALHLSLSPSHRAHRQLAHSAELESGRDLRNGGGGTRRDAQCVVVSFCALTFFPSHLSRELIPRHAIGHRYGDLAAGGEEGGQGEGRAASATARACRQKQSSAAALDLSHRRGCALRMDTKMRRSSSAICFSFFFLGKRDFVCFNSRVFFPKEKTLPPPRVALSTP